MSNTFKELMEEYDATIQQLQEATQHLLELSSEMLDAAIEISNG